MREGGLPDTQCVSASTHFFTTTVFDPAPSPSPMDSSPDRIKIKLAPPPPTPLFPSQSIADINQSLCDDGLVDKDKIGGSNYYWSFPAKKDRLLQLEHEETLSKIEALRSSVKDAEVRLADAKRGREEEEEEEGGAGGSSSSRASKMARRSELLAETAAARIDLEKLRQNDPREIANLEREFELVRGAAHRWTDNIFSCKDYLVKKRGMMKAEGECAPPGGLGYFFSSLCQYFSIIAAALFADDVSQPPPSPLLSLFLPR